MPPDRVDVSIISDLHELPRRGDAATFCLSFNLSEDWDRLGSRRLLFICVWKLPETYDEPPERTGHTITAK